MVQEGVGFTRVTASRVINEGQTLLFGALILVSVTGGSISLYEGTDASSGRLIATVEGEANITHQLKFNTPLYLDRGLYVSVGSNVTEATVIWLPLVGE